jgi:monoterpene epsilon-lactone hydrolase
MKYIQQFRADFDRRERPYDYEPSVIISKTVIAGIDCYWFIPEDLLQDRIVLYIHGGGFGAGSLQSHDKMVSHLAKNLGARILFIEYRLAPEHPYPAGIQDVLRVYQDILGQHPYAPIDLIGDSAGGGLIISLVDSLISAGIDLPHGLVLISPWYNLHSDYPSILENASLDKTLNKEMLDIFAQAYRGNKPLDITSPSSLVFAQFPPVLIMVGTDEIVLDDSKYFYNYIKDIQPLSRLSIYKGQAHVWPKKDVHSQSAQGAFKETREFLEAILIE